MDYYSQYKDIDIRFKTNEIIEKSGFKFVAKVMRGSTINESMKKFAI